MNAGAKIIIGLIIIVIGFGLFADSPTIGAWGSVTGVNWWNNFLVVVTGIIPALLILIGVFVVWLEADELSAEKEMATEEKAEATAEVKAAVAPRKKPGRPKKK